MACSALCTFYRTPSSNLRRWNRIIKQQVFDRKPYQAMQTYIKMQETGVHGDNFTFPILLKAAALLSSLRIGAALHAQIIKTGFAVHAFVQTAAIYAYAVFGCIESARKVFDKMPQRDLVAWNSMLHACASHRQMDIAGQLFDLMPIKDQISFNIMISGYASVGCIDCAEKLFDEIPMRDVVSWNSMVLVYVEAGEMGLANEVFDRMSERNVVSFNTMIAGYLRCQHHIEAVDLFYKMKASKLEPNHVTLIGVLSACAQMGSLETGREIHVYAGEFGLVLNPYVASALIDMYAKCGSIEGALEVFYKCRDKDICSWNAMISGLSVHGYGRASIKLFGEMRIVGVKPDDITFIGLLSACSHAGLVREGYYFFECMESEYGISPKSEHYGCMVDLLGRAGFLDRAYSLIKSLPFEPGIALLGALLGACTIHGNIEMGERAAECIVSKADHMGDGEYMMLVNMYASCGRLEEARKWRGMMNDGGISKPAGCSMIEVNGRMYRFLAGGLSKV